MRMPGRSLPFYFYPRPPRGGRLYKRRLCDVLVSISIHALREEGDAMHDRSCPAFRISIHALREEGDIALAVHSSRLCHFYPRPPRGGRPDRARLRPQPDYFYPRPPRGGRLSDPRLGFRPVLISIHALREEGDTDDLRAGQGPRSISIHALREEGDRLTSSTRRPPPYFYPRPPRGGRLDATLAITCRMYFYPRPPRGGRHGDRGRRDLCGSISIHALREEGDILILRVRLFFFYFYPRPPRGGRLAALFA